MTGPDPDLARLFNESPPEHRDALARILGSADYLGRHVELHDAPRAIAAAWLVYAAMDAHTRGRPEAHALTEIADQVLADVGGRMAVLVGLAQPTPDTPDGL